MSKVESLAELMPQRQRRRTLIKGAAWSVPVLALAVASPAAAASVVDIGAFGFVGTCGVLGVHGPGFIIMPSATAPIPTGTTIVITGSGVSNIGAFSATPSGYTSIAVLSSTSRMVMVIAPIPAGVSVALRATLWTSVQFTLNSAVAVPDAYSATGAKTAGTVSSTVARCSTT